MQRAAGARFTIYADVNVPQTGDNGQMALWLLVIRAAALAAQKKIITK